MEGMCCMIGRKEEREYLLSLINEDEPQFVAVFGRRRIGKTYLVRESFEHKFTFQYTGISNNQIEPGTRKMAQLNKFAESLKEAGYKGNDKLDSWNDALNALKEVLKNRIQKGGYHVNGIRFFRFVTNVARGKLFLFREITLYFGELFY